MKGKCTIGLIPSCSWLDDSFYCGMDLPICLETLGRSTWNRSRWLQGVSWASVTARIDWFLSRIHTLHRYRWMERSSPRRLVLRLSKQIATTVACLWVSRLMRLDPATSRRGPFCCRESRDAESRWEDHESNWNYSIGMQGLCRTSHAWDLNSNPTSKAVAAIADLRFLAARAFLSCTCPLHLVSQILQLFSHSLESNYRQAMMIHCSKSSPSFGWKYRSSSRSFLKLKDAFVGWLVW